MEKRILIALVFYLMLIAKELTATMLSAQVEIQKKPVFGIVIKDTPGLLLTERKLVSHLVFVQLDPHKAISDQIKLPGPDESVAFTKWYDQHISQTKESAKDILRQLVKTFVAKSHLPTNRPKRFLGTLIAGVVMAVISAVVGSSMSIANIVTVSTLNERTEHLQNSLINIRGRLNAQDNITDQILQIVNDTVIVQNSHSEAINRLTDLQEKVVRTQTMYCMLVDPILYLTQNYLRQLQFNLVNLIKGNIPLYFVSSSDIKTILGQLQHVIVDDMQIRIALEMVTALPVFIDVDNLQMSYLLNLPLVLPEKFYQMKNIFNMGAWKDDSYLKLKTPSIPEYQPWNNSTYFVLNLDTCVVFKDTNHLCPGKPFKPEFSNIGCGVTNIEDSLSTCEVTVSKPDQYTFNTVVAILNKRWLVSAIKDNMTVTYAVNGTYKLVVPLEHRILLITVPKEFIVTIGSHVLFHISGAEMTENIQLDLEWLIQHKPNHTLKFSVKKQNVTVEKYLYDKHNLNLMGEKDWLAVRVAGLSVAVGFLTLWMAAVSFIVYCNSKSRKVKLNDGVVIREDPSYAKIRIIANDPEVTQEVKEEEDDTP